MALLHLGKAVNDRHSDDKVTARRDSVERVAGLLLYMSLSNNCWINASNVAAIADSYCSIRRKSSWYNRGIYDAWGRIRRTEIWG